MRRLSRAWEESISSKGKFHTSASTISTAAWLDRRTKLGVCSMGTRQKMIIMLTLLSSGNSAARQCSGIDTSMGTICSISDTLARTQHGALGKRIEFYILKSGQVQNVFTICGWHIKVTRINSEIHEKS